MHRVLVLDRAGGHTSVRLRVPEHLHLLVLPPYPPDLHPAAQVWPLTNSVLVTRHFATSEQLDDVSCARCAELQRHPEQIRSTTLFHWWPKRVTKRQGPRLR